MAKLLERLRNLRGGPSPIGWILPTVWAAYLIVVPPAMGLRPDIFFASFVLVVSVAVIAVAFRYCRVAMLWVAGPGLLFTAFAAVAFARWLHRYFANL